MEKAASDKVPTVGIAVITHCAVKHLSRCLPPFLNSPLKPRVVVVNSSSNDGTVEFASAMGVETLVIPRSEFNHGTTRERARQYLGTDIVVMVTPDAYATDTHVLEKLVAPIVEGKACVTYARQIAHDGAGFFESFPREFNYPAKGHIRSVKDLNKYGVYSYFCSNSFAAYSNRTLDEIGGFSPVLLGEDTIVVAKLLKRGKKIAYVADAVVKHSHRYNLRQEFRRHFDTGLSRRSYRHLISEGGTDNKRGWQYVKEMMKQLTKYRPILIPYAIVQTFIKWIGYRIGCVSAKAPFWFKKCLSSQDFYWNNRKKSFE